MKNVTETVKSVSGENPFEQSFSMPLPETWEEAVEKYTFDGAWNIFIAGLKVKLQNIAREGFRKKKSVEDVEKDLADYKGPATTKETLVERAFDLLTEKADLLRVDPETTEKVRGLMKSNKFREAVELMEVLGEE